MQDEQKWAEHLPSEGEHPEHAAKQEDRQSIEETLRSPEYQQAAGAAPKRADPQAAEANREFVEDTAMRYNRAEEEFSKSDP